MSGLSILLKYSCRLSLIWSFPKLSPNILDLGFHCIVGGEFSQHSKISSLLKVLKVLARDVYRRPGITPQTCSPHLRQEFVFLADQGAKRNPHQVLSQVHRVIASLIYARGMRRDVDPEG